MMNAKLLAPCVSMGLLAGCHHGWGHRENAEKSTKEIQAMYAQWVKAFEAKDVNGVMAMYAPGAALTAYDMVPPLQYKGADAYRKDYTEFFAQFDGPIHVDVSDTHIEADRGVAFAYGIERLTGKMTNGTPVDMWIRWTDGWKRMDGGSWRVVHEHVSVPVDMATGKARMDLKP
jgi:ketosteroid isomerase-like protein